MSAGSLQLDDLAGATGHRLGVFDVPCPVCGPERTEPANRRRRVLRVWREEPDFARYHCARCGLTGWCRSDDSRAIAPARLAQLKAEAVRRQREYEAAKVSNVAAALRIFDEARDLRGTIAESYLASRGLTLDPDIADLRFHVAGRMMIGLYRDIHTDEPCGIHRTFLTSDGAKDGRKMLGRATCAAIKIDPDADVTMGLHIGEGIETCLAARQLGYRPVWALGSAGAIARFPLLPGIEALSVFSENDKASADAAQVACNRYLAAGCEAWVWESPQGDINDAIRDED